MPVTFGSRAPPTGRTVVAGRPSPPGLDTGQDHGALERRRAAKRRRGVVDSLTAQCYVLVLIPFQSLVDLLNAIVRPHFIQHIEVRIHLSLIHISEPTRLGMISYAVFCL